MANGNGASAFSKIVASVTTIALVAVTGFGLKVYAFMEDGERFTNEDAAVTYVRKDVYERDRKHFEDTLIRMEKKLDKALERQ